MERMDIYMQKKSTQKHENEVRAPSEGSLSYVCTACGWVYGGATLPEDIICPICGEGADAFSPIEPK